MITRQILIYGGLAVGAVGLVLLLKNKNKSGGLLDGLGIDTEDETTEVPKPEAPKLSTPPLVSNPIGDLVNSTTNSLNLASATLLLGQRTTALEQTKEPEPQTKTTLFGNVSFSKAQWAIRVEGAKAKIVQIDKQLNALGYKVDQNQTLVKI
jgi:hypothetical protein